MMQQNFVAADIFLEFLNATPFPLTFRKKLSKL